MTKKEVTMDAGMLDDVIKDFKITYGAIVGMTGVFDTDDGLDDYWSQEGKLNAVESVLINQKERLFKSIEELCRLAGRPAFTETLIRGEGD
jgi:hypothetical protein